MSETAKVVENESAARPAAARGETSLREYIESLLVTVILALFGTTFIVQAFKMSLRRLQWEEPMRSKRTPSSSQAARRLPDTVRGQKA